MSLIQKIREWRWRQTMCGARSTHSGLRFHLRGFDDWLIWHEIFEAGEYDESLALLCAKAKQHSEPVTVLDLGANVGFFALRLFDCWKTEGLSISRLHVLSIEPDDKNCAAIEELRCLNTIPKTQWQVIQGLVGEISGYGYLSVGPGHFAHSVAKGETRNGKRVPYINLRSLMGGSLGSDYLKIDIEGSEDNLLMSEPLLLQESAIVCIETHSESSRTRVLRDLAKSGFPPPVERILKSGDGPLLTTMWTNK